MTDPVSGGHQELVDVIRQVRRRWRTKLLLGGGIIVLGGGLLALTLGVLGSSGATVQSVVGHRVPHRVSRRRSSALVALWLVRPLRRRVTDLQVALYVEEHEPSLQAAMLSAVDVGATSGEERPRACRRVILDRMVEQAVERCRSIQGGRDIGRKTIRRRTVVLGALAAVAALLLVVGPEFFRQGASALLVLSRSAEAASPYAIKVTPGDVTVPKGSDQSVSAVLTGFRSSNVALMMRAEGEAGVPASAAWSSRARPGRSRACCST